VESVKLISATENQSNVYTADSGSAIWLFPLAFAYKSDQLLFCTIERNIYKRVIESDRAQASFAEQRHRLTKQKRARSEQERWQRFDVSQYKSKTTRC